MAFEWVAGLFQSEEARGLSGESASSVALDDANPYYNYRLRRHATDGDIVADPGLIWYTSPYVTQRQGLGTHIGAEPGEGVANYTDVLLILSAEDFRRAQQISGEPWTRSIERTLQQEFENFCRRENLHRPHSHRPLGFRVLCDGSTEMHGLSLGLERGEFITGLLPNLYTGTVVGSYPVIGVHVNLPGVWEGYKEVGRLHNDQILFTLGNHWLDNFSHPALAEAALYRLQQYPDGNFVHIINPDLQDRYQVTSTVQNNASVLTLATREGRPLAYLVLAVMEAPTSQAPPPPRTQQPKISMPTAASKPKPPSDFDSGIPSVAPPMLIDDEVQPVTSSSPNLGGKTIIPDAPSERIFTLQERGALLQKVHFSAFMLGYDVFMGTRGELGTKVESPAATFQVRKRSTALVAHVPGVMVGGEAARVGDQIPLDRDTEILLGDTRLEYRDLRQHQDLTGWPYVAEIRRPASSTYLIWGEEYRVGRSRECRVVLPDQTSNDNIHWKPKVGDGAYIRARTGDIPKANFYTDSIMVSSEHATIDLSGNEPRIECNASHCYVFVRRKGEILALHPTSKADFAHELSVEPGDEILVGNCLFQVGFSPAGQGVAPAPAPEVQFSADSLADAVPDPDFSQQDTPPPIADKRATPAPAEPLQATAEYVDDELPAEDTAEIPASVDPVSDAAAADDEPTIAVRPGFPDEEEAWRDEPEDQEPEDEEPQDEEPAADDGFDDEWDEEAAPDDATAEVDDEEGETQMWSLPERPDAEDLPAASGLGEDGAEPEPIVAESTAPDSIIGTLADFGLDEDVSVDQPGLVEGDDLPTKPLPERKAAPGLLQQSTFSSELSDPESSPTGDPEEPEEEEEAASEPRDWGEDLASDTTQPPPPSDDEEASDDFPAAPSEVPMPFPELDMDGVELSEDAPSEPPPGLEAPTKLEVGRNEVVYTDDAEAQFELGRPCHVIQAGWMVNGEVVVGNHLGADLILPENRILETQTFVARDYLRLKIRGRRGSMEVLEPTEVLIDEADPSSAAYDPVEGHVIDVIRRDEEGEEDFAIRLVVVEDKRLPDPRARMVALDYEDPLAAALVTRGLPLNQPRVVELGGVTMTMTFTGSAVRVTDYLATYKTAAGFRPFFVQSGDKRFTTAPEDGTAFELADGDRFVVEQSVYVVREE